MVWILMSFLWGCAHGGKTRTVQDDQVPPTASPVDLVEDDTATADTPVDDDPFFADEENYWNDNGGTDEDFFEPDQPVSLESNTLISDPLMPFNRVTFSMNDRMYFWVLKPVATGYKKVTPAFFRKGVRNFFKNIAMPVRFVSAVLQGKFKGAGSELSRFVVNTTVGVGGLFDPAESYFHLKPCDEDIGQVLGKYGIGNGVYIVWPLLGPSTVRDSVGKVGDIVLNPLYSLDHRDLSLALGGLDLVNHTSFRLGDYEAVKRASMDPYVMIRDFYVHFRQKQIAE